MAVPREDPRFDTLRESREISPCRSSGKLDWTTLTEGVSVIAVCTPLTVVPRSLLMSVIITFMLEPAKLQMNWARPEGAGLWSHRLSTNETPTPLRIGTPVPSGAWSPYLDP